MTSISDGMGVASAADIASARANNAARAARSRNAATPASVAAAPPFSFTPFTKAATPASVAMPAVPSFKPITAVPPASQNSTITALRAQLNAAEARVAELKARIAAKKGAPQGGRRTRRKRHA